MPWNFKQYFEDICGLSITQTYKTRDITDGWYSGLQLYKGQGHVTSGPTSSRKVEARVLLKVYTNSAHNPDRKAIIRALKEAIEKKSGVTNITLESVRSGGYSSTRAPKYLLDGARILAVDSDGSNTAMGLNVGE